MHAVVAELPCGSIVGEEELEAVRRVLASGESLSWGADAIGFEEDFRAYSGAKHALSFSSCTTALDVCAELLRLGPEDEVIATPQTFWATVAALVRRRVRVRFADVDPNTLNIDPAALPPLFNARTKAIYVVHYGGAPVDLDPIRALAEAHAIPVVEDCAHANGSEYRGHKLGSGDLCCFSFQSQKNMTTLAEGGMLTTNNPEWARQAEALRALGVLGATRPRPPTFGPYRKPERVVGWDASTGPSIRHAQEGASEWDVDFTRIDAIGSKTYLSALASAVGRVQLKKLDGLNAARRRVANRYREGVSRIAGLRAPAEPAFGRSAHHLFTCFVEPASGVDRDALTRHLADHGGVVLTQRYWPLHLAAALRVDGHGLGECPRCERAWFEEQLALPIHPSFSDETVDRVLTALEDGMKALRRG